MGPSVLMTFPFSAKQKAERRGALVELGGLYKSKYMMHLDFVELSDYISVLEYKSLFTFF